MKLRKNKSAAGLSIDEYAKRLFSDQTRQFQKPFYTTKDLMDLTGWSERTIQALRDNCEIPFIKHGRKILYPRDEVFAFLNDHLVE